MSDAIMNLISQGVLVVGLTWTFLSYKKLAREHVELLVKHLALMKRSHVENMALANAIQSNIALHVEIKALKERLGEGDNDAEALEHEEAAEAVAEGAGEPA